MSLSSSDLAEIRQFQSETDAIREAPQPLAARLTVFVLAGLLVTLTLIAFLTRMDRVVTSVSGKIVPTKLVNVFQALDPSIIKTIDVHEGDQVRKGQVLATLDPTFTGADVTQLKLSVASLTAKIIRAEAELVGKAPEFPKTTDPDAERYASLQQELYRNRMAQYKAQLASFDGKIKQTQATIEKLRMDNSRYAQRENIAGEIEQMRTTLAERGTGSLLNKLISQDQRLELLRTIESTHNSLVESQHTLESIRADRQAFIEQWQSDLTKDLVQARNDLDTARAQLEKAERHKDLVRLVAPEDGVVLLMAKLSPGSVLKQGDTMFTLMPARASVEAEIQILSRDIGFVRVGDPCVLKIDAFRFTEHGTAEGKVLWISDGAFTTDENDKPVDAYYKARCSVEHLNFRNVPAHFRLIPGMTLSADMKVGTRSVGGYLLSGVTRGLFDAMREP